MLTGGVTCLLCPRALPTDAALLGEYRGQPVHRDCAQDQHIVELYRMIGDLHVGPARPRYAPSTIDFSELADELDDALDFERERLSA